MSNDFHLILGGARSGKSKLAEKLAIESGKQLVYVATATAGDAEMARRIRHHQERRQEEWHVVEEPTAIANVLQQQQGENTCIVVDCLSLWLSNCLHQQCWQEEKQALLDGLENINCPILFVSNETGLGVVPMGELTRSFVDESGFLHQQLASHCDRVTLCVAGIPVKLK